MKKFDPEGEGFDHRTAKRYRIDSNACKVPLSGRILIGRGHRMWAQMVRDEEQAGHKVRKSNNGYYYSKPRESTIWTPRATKISSN